LSTRPCAVLLALILAVSIPRSASARQQVPKGEVLKFTFNSSTIFPGTTRDYWVYIPAQYDGKSPACLYVNQDGLQWDAPAVFDRLIQAKEMPVTIGVFVMHGRVPAAAPDSALDRFNRSLEYDGLGDRYARFLEKELLPEVEKRTATDGRPIRLSKDPNDRAIGGASSGAVCAFTAAWERPDLFRRVFSSVGTYVGLRGADRYPTLIRKYEPKPLRIFLEDGSNDQNIYAGDWWFANQMMERALTFAGYEVAHAWGDGGHNGQHGTAVFPDAMRWLWKDWQKPLVPGTSKNVMLADILQVGSGWEQLGGYRGVWGLSADPQKAVHFYANTAGDAFRIGPGGFPEGDPGSSQGGVQAFGPDGTRYRTDYKGILKQPPGGKETRLTDLAPVNALIVSNAGDIWAATTPLGAGSSTLWRIGLDGGKKAVESPRCRVGGLALSPDQTLLYASANDSHWIWSYQIAQDRSLAHGQQYYWLHSPDESDASGAAAMCVDRDGRLYVATLLGVQVCDQAGRVNAILPLPENAWVGTVCFGGDDFNTLYAFSGGKLYRRKLAIKGRQAWEAPNKPAAPRL
jgi:sugar lactone lactonase YvrE/enterochelin esterase-like enzyme